MADQEHSNTAGCAAKDIEEIIRQLATHYGLWLAESVHHLGLDAALSAEKEAGDRFFAILRGKLERATGARIDDFCTEENQEVLEKLGSALRSAWLAADGVWFQAVEKQVGMDAAKRVNDTCWSRFAPLEARRAMDILKLAKGGGIEALKAALSIRMYAKLNKWEFLEQTDKTIVFRMKECRVQTARKRKGLDDYPCKSGGVTEYTTFAKEIDPRLHCECIGCPPDAHPQEWVCSWRFTLTEES